MMKKILYSLIVLLALCLPISANIHYATIGFETKVASAQTIDPRCTASGNTTAISCARFLQTQASNTTGNGDTTPGIFDWWGNIQVWVGNALLSLAGIVVYAAAYLLNLAVYYGIVNMSAFVNSLSGIAIAWGVIRDLANIVFIFLLIWIAVSTILSLSSGASYRTLSKLIVIALLINFSLFFTKVIIDTSNIVTLQFYNAIPDAQSDPMGDHSAGIGVAFVKAMALPSIYDFNGAANRTDANGLAPANNPNPLGNGNGQVVSGTNVALTPHNILMIGIMGSIFLIVAAFVFFIAAILLLVRLAVLIILMIISPLAYVGMLLPKSVDISSKWWSELFNQAIFAPVFMMFMYVILRIISDQKFFTGLYSNGSTAAGQTSVSGLVDAFVGGSVAAVVQFGVLIIFLMTALIVAKQMGKYGGGAAISLGTAALFGTAGFIGRNTVGRATSKFATTDFAKNMAARGGLAGLYGKAQLATAQKAANASFDARGSKMLGALAGQSGVKVGKPTGKGGYEAILKRQTDADVKMANAVGDGMFYGVKGNDEGVKKRYLDAKKMRDDAKARLPKLEKDLAEAKKFGRDTTALQMAVTNAQNEKRSSAKIMVDMRANGEVKTKKNAYADNLEKSTSYRTLLLKVPRKYKEAAKKIRKVKKPEEKFKDLIDEAAKETAAAAPAPAAAPATP